MDWTSAKQAPTTLRTYTKTTLHFGGSLQEKSAKPTPVFVLRAQLTLGYLRIPAFKTTLSIFIPFCAILLSLPIKN